MDTTEQVKVLEVDAQAVDKVDPQTEQELEAMKQRVKEMEQEAAKLREMQAQVEKEMNLVHDGDSKEDIDSRSIFVGNVDYGASPEEVQAHFQSCGTINRVTILCDKWTGHPKGYAYVEFSEAANVANALVLNDSLFRGRAIKVTTKRTNLPGFSRGRGRGRGRGFRGAMPYVPRGYFGVYRGAFPRRGGFAPY